MKKLFIYIFMSFLCVLMSFVLLGCQDVFTTGLFSFMRTDPADMSRKELIQYGWNVIGTGDNEKMLDTYDAVKEMLTDNPDDGELSYLAAKLAIEMSGLADYMIDLPEENITEYKNELDSTYIMEAGDFFVIAYLDDMILNAIDAINCGIGLLLTSAGGDFAVMETIDIDAPGSSEEQLGAAYIDAGTDVLGSDYRDLIILAFFTVIP